MSDDTFAIVTAVGIIGGGIAVGIGAHLLGERDARRERKKRAGRKGPTRQRPPRWPRS